MRATLCLVLASFVSLCGSAYAQPAKTSSDSERLIGAWHLVAMEDAAVDGKITHVTDRKGILIYTRDGHMSVQLMLPPAESNVSNDYVEKGYEASFGSYNVDEKAHTVTHHVEGSVTRGLVGKDLPRAYQLSGRRLIIHSTRADEHWSVVWEHD